MDKGNSDYHVGEQVHREKKIAGFSCSEAYGRVLIPARVSPLMSLKSYIAEFIKSLTPKKNKDQNNRNQVSTPTTCKSCNENTPGESYNKIFNSKSTFEFQSKPADFNAFTIQVTSYERYECK